MLVAIFVIPALSYAIMLLSAVLFGSWIGDKLMTEEYIIILLVVTVAYIIKRIRT
jgi:hypothetical protein